MDAVICDTQIKHASDCGVDHGCRPADIHLVIGPSARAGDDLADLTTLAIERTVLGHGGYDRQPRMLLREHS